MDFQTINLKAFEPLVKVAAQQDFQPFRSEFPRKLAHYFRQTAEDGQDENRSPNKRYGLCFYRFQLACCGKEGGLGSNCFL